GRTLRRLSAEDRVSCLSATRRRGQHEQPVLRLLSAVLRDREPPPRSARGACPEIDPLFPRGVPVGILAFLPGESPGRGLFWPGTSAAHRGRRPDLVPAPGNPRLRLRS